MKVVFKQAIICRVVALLCISLLFGGVSVSAASPSLDSLDRFFNDIKTFRARFTQVVLDENLSVIDDSNGMVWVQRPGLFRWDYAPPQAQEIVGDGTRVWLYDIALEQITVRDQAKALGHAPAVLLAGTDNLTQAYRIEDIGTQGRFDWVRLIPIETESGFSEVRIGFEKSQIRLIELVDALEQRTRISFVGMSENIEIAAEVFNFVAPPGIDVIQQLDQ